MVSLELLRGVLLQQCNMELVVFLTLGEVLLLYAGREKCSGGRVMFSSSCCPS
jgi:hypothetical protein